jgi:hypothetical protein
MKYLILALLLSGLTVTARAEDLSAKDRTYLNERFGIDEQSQIATDMTADERAAIHALIVNPWTQDYPPIRDARVQSELFTIYTRQCGDWARAYQQPACPPAATLEMQPGKVIADERCNVCHLFGTADTPPFFTFARKGGLTRTRLASALAQGHRMSPITLTPEQIDALLAYINGLK